MGMEYEMTIQNEGSSTSDITIFDTGNPTSIPGADYSFTLPYLATYLAATFFIFNVEGNLYTIYLTQNTTRNDVLTLFNNLGFGQWELNPSTVNNIYICRCPYIISSLDLDVLTQPVATAATVINATSFTANWNNVSGATGYFLDVATDSAFTNFVTGYENKDVGLVTSYNVTGLTVNVTYYYRLRSYYSILTSANSNVISLQTVDLFNIGTGFDSDVFVVQLQTDGKILVGGQFAAYNGTTSNRIIRLNTDGSVDTSFSIGTGIDGTSVLCISVQTDGKILVGGNFTSYNGTLCNYIIRLNSDGSVDTSFSIGTGFSSIVRAIQVQIDGKILIGGQFISYNGTTSNRIIRLNTDGSIDSSFSIGTGFSGTIYCISIQTDGKIWVGGQYTTYNTTIQSARIIRLNSDGSVDFSILNGFNSIVRAIQVQTDGKILVGGQFTSYNGTTSNRIIRLNTNGSIDSSFIIGTGFSSNVISIQIQTDSKILAGGEFISYNSTTSSKIIRLNSDGSVDTSFSIGTGFNNAPQSIQIQTNGKILLGGSFTGYKSNTRLYIIRLNADGTDNTIGT